MVGRPPSPALPPPTTWGKGDASRRTEARSKFNLPQGFLGEVGEVYEPGGGARGRSVPPPQRDRILLSPLQFRGERPGEGGAVGRSAMPFGEARGPGAAVRSMPKRAAACGDPNLLQCFSGEVGEVYEPGGGAPRGQLDAGSFHAQL
jgi:hypothetical protein